MHAHEQTRNPARSHRTLALLALVAVLLVLAVPVAAAARNSGPDDPGAVVVETATTATATTKAEAFVPAPWTRNPERPDDFPPRTSTTAPPTTPPPTTAPPTTAAPTTAPPTTVPPPTAPPTTTPPPPPPPPPPAVPAAPSGGVWDALAQCESGGNWAINTGNGYYGGLQFNLGSWRSVGGSGYPHENSRETQIAMGQRLQASQGWGAWPSCSSKLGLR